MNSLPLVQCTYLGKDGYGWIGLDSVFGQVGLVCVV